MAEKNYSENADQKINESLFDPLGMSEGSVKKFLSDRDRYDRSKHVCICGHAINKHSGYERGLGVCLTGRHWCPCIAENPVLYANDTRYFMRKTYGLGSKHALSTGLAKLAQVRKKAFWLEEPSCWNPHCSRVNKLIFPVSMDKDSQIINEPGPINVFLCETCSLNLKGVPGNEGKGWVW